VHFVATFDRAFTATRTGNATALTFDASRDRTVTMRVAISYIDAAGAAGNLAAEAPPRLSFERMRKQARAAWNDRLRRIRADGGSAELRRTFYTSLYRFYLMPSVFDDADGRYLGMDGQVRTVRPGRHHYTALSLWDTYRTQMPLLELIEPRIAHDVAISLLDDADANNGVIPRWVQANIDREIMGGDSATAIVADAVQEGVLDDVESKRAFDAMWRQATTLPAVAGREGLAGYLERGWVGQDETGRSGAALTLEYAIDDTALLGVARRYGTPEQVAALEQRAANWRNLMNPGSRFLQPRNKDGSWPNPHPSGALGMPWRPEFQDGWQEGTGWQYLWFVPQDVVGLAEAMGGYDVALQRLDEFFAAPATVQDKGSFFGVYYIGNQFTPSNETDLWVPWYYDWLGQPWKTQREVRQAMSVYNSRPDGMPGNDDTGTMSAFYVLAALGLYHAQPGVPAWQLNSPSFAKAVVDTGAKRFTIEAPGTSRVNKYIQAASFGRRRFERTWLTSQELRGGGRVRYELGARPNKEWGAGADAAPPSLSAR
jgi:predicted alpha-1,2-mannosidase